MHSSRRSRWQAAPGRGQTFETSVSERASTASTVYGETGELETVAGGWRHRKESSERGGGGRDGGDRQGDGTRGLYRAARHVSFFLIIIFNPIHCMVQQFALTPTSEILQGSLSDESPWRWWIRSAG